jgi:SAM-dependent methyltransferase
VSFGEFTGAAHESAPRGFRWWRVSPIGELYSAWFDQPWDAYANEATCAIPVSRVSRRAWTKRHADGVPAPGCSCGFYALHRVPEQVGDEPDPERPWLLDPEGWSGLGASVVFGVAEAWGRVLIGTEGWRSRSSRAIALFVPQGSDLWSSDRIRLLSERYSIPITASLETLVGEWAPEPIEEARPVTRRLALPIGLDVRSSGHVIATPVAQRPDRGVPDRPDVSPRAPLPGPQPAPDLASRTERQVAAIERLVGDGPKRILELGAGAGYRTSPLGDRGHSVVSVAGDFSRIDLPGPFDVVGYFGGFGAGTDDEQRDLLRHIAHWVEPDGCVLIEVLTPWCWTQAAPRQPAVFPKGERAHEWLFDADACRMRVRAGPLWDEGATDMQTLRCYSPADLRLLLENTGLVLDTLEPFAGDGYETVPSLEAAKLYLARLVRKA